MRLVRRQVVLGKHCVLGAHRGTVSTVNALVGVDIDLRNGSRRRVARGRRNRRRCTLRNAHKILCTSIRYYISHCNLLAVRDRRARRHIATTLKLPSRTRSLRDPSHMHSGISLITVRRQLQPECNLSLMQKPPQFRTMQAWNIQTGLLPSCGPSAAGTGSARC